MKPLERTMVAYRRNFKKGATYFFTVALWNRKSTLLVDHIHLLRESFQVTQCAAAYKIDAIVILPDHIHTIWTLPKNDFDYSARWKKIKSHFTRGLIKNKYSLKKNERGEYKVWQRRFWEHTIFNEEDYKNHINYIHFNPVKHGLRENVIDWPYSSFHYYVNEGKIAKNWGSQFRQYHKHSYGE